jgi:hypothetical protein
VVFRAAGRLRKPGQIGVRAGKVNPDFATMGREVNSRSSLLRHGQLPGQGAEKDAFVVANSPEI